MSSLILVTIKASLRRCFINSGPTLVILLALALGLGSPSVSSGESNELMIDVSIERSGTNEYSLHIHLKNNGSAILTLEEQLLPWGNTKSMGIVAVKNDLGYGLIERALDFDDPVHQDIQIKPGQSLEGKVSLADFGNLHKERLKSDVIIFWTYEMLLREGRRLPRSGGWLVLTKLEVK